MSTINPDAIDVTKPTTGAAFTTDVRANEQATKDQFQNAKNDIEAHEARVDNPHSYPFVGHAYPILANGGFQAFQAFGFGPRVMAHGEYLADMWKFQGTNVMNNAIETEGGLIIDSTRWGLRFRSQSAGGISGTPGVTDASMAWMEPIEFSVAIPLQWWTAPGPGIKPAYLALRFGIQSSVAFTSCIRIANGAEDYGYLWEFSHAGGGIQYFEHIVPPPTIPLTLPGARNSRALSFSFVFFPRTISKTSGAWQTLSPALLDGTPNCTNPFTTQHDIDLFDVQAVPVLANDLNPPYRCLSFAHNQTLCERQFQKSYALHTVPGTITQSGMLMEFGIASNAGEPGGLWSPLRTPLRATPTMVWYSPLQGTVNQIDGQQSGVWAQYAVSSSNYAGDSSTGTPVLSTPPAGATFWGAQYTADARL